ncbi:hypothetical protein LE190_17085 [Massilia oculi]|uniref:Uncharacterized protein n=1 Tax=Massilia hydrophila TaxID=3044279 RepID=A0ABS7YFC9_9BURK|nr:hypothetical protein [Massilia oculi]MCA1857631.1 hypothetical protein [Massilia oculi]
MPAFTKQWLLDTGFAEVPTYWPAEPGDMLFRVFGDKNKLLGSCYSFEAPRCVSEAEWDANIVKWDNLCRYVARFRVLGHIPMWVGRIDQDFARHGREAGVGPVIGGNPHAVQAWMEPTQANFIKLELVEPARLLVQDGTVMADRHPNQVH